MHKDGLVLLLTLAMFALLGAECQLPWQNKKDEQNDLPERALASSSLLRAYYNARSFKHDMRDIKIPEGNDFDEPNLVVEFDMTSTAAVTDVRTHLYIVPPFNRNLEDCELVCRCKAPDGTISSWKAVDFTHSGATDGFDLQAEVSFPFEFDAITNADGIWQVHVRDHIEDGDGRCLFRNGSLHINQGGVSLVTPATSSESVSLDSATGRYGILPERAGKRMPFDLGSIGASRMLRNNFTFGSSFNVTTIGLEMSLYADVDASLETKLAFMIVSPSGNWYMDLVGERQNLAFPFDPSTLSLVSYTFSVDVFPDGRLMNLHGEPSAGTWSVYLVDLGVDGATMVLTTDGTDGITVTPNGGEFTLTLSGEP